MRNFISMSLVIVTIVAGISLLIGLGVAPAHAAGAAPALPVGWWGLFALATALVGVGLGLQPHKGPSREEEAEAAFFAAAAAEQAAAAAEQAAVAAEQAAVAAEAAAEQAAVAAEAAFEAAFEAALEEDARHFAAWTAAKKAEIATVLDQIEAALWADHLIMMPRRNRPWLPPSLGLT